MMHGLVPKRQQPHAQRPPDTLAGQLEATLTHPGAKQTPSQRSTQTNTILEAALPHLQRHQAGVRCIS